MFFISRGQDKVQPEVELSVSNRFSYLSLFSLSFSFLSFLLHGVLSHFSDLRVSFDSGISPSSLTPLKPYLFVVSMPMSPSAPTSSLSVCVCSPGSLAKYPVRSPTSDDLTSTVIGDFGPSSPWVGSFPSLLSDPSINGVLWLGVQGPS